MTFSKWVSSIELQGSEENCLTSHDTDIIFITCNVKLSNDDVKPDRFLSRFEFLQASRLAPLCWPCFIVIVCNLS